MFAGIKNFFAESRKEFPSDWRFFWALSIISFRIS